MVGLPFEEHGDVEAIVTLTEQIRERMLAVARGRGRIGRLHPSVNPFVPKPGTPYQWLPMEDPKETDRKLQYLRKAFAKIPNVDAIIKSARTRPAQSALALGDRRMADALEVAVTGAHGLQARDARARASTPRSTSSAAAARDEVLPWDIVDNGVSKAYFLRELDKSDQEKLSPALPRDPGLHPLRRLRGDAEPLLPPAREVEGPRHLPALPEDGRARGRSRPGLDRALDRPVSRRPAFPEQIRHPICWMPRIFL